MLKRFLTSRTTRRRVVAAGAALAAAGLVEPGGAQGAPQASPNPASWPLLLVDDAKTANSDLIAVELQVPNGFDVGGHTLRLPQGFSISILAAGLQRPRFMAFDQAGNLLVADAAAGDVYRYTAASDGTIQPAASAPAPLLSGLNAPSNVAFFAGYLYVGETNQVSRYRYSPSGEVGDQDVVIPNLPTGGHTTRTIAFGPDRKLYLGVGSSCNICQEQDERRAAVLRYNPDGTGYERFAWGLRNPVGLAFQPGTDLLWAAVNERDNQGNEIPPDLITIVLQGANYGWPTCQPPHAKPQDPGDTCSGITPPTIGIQAHSAPLGLTFYTGERFPAAYRGNLFVAQHGSWNRQPPSPPKILQIAFDQGRPTGARDFATGWQNEAGDRWGRPAGALAAPDGSLIVSDDTAGLLYRIAAGG